MKRFGWIMILAAALAACGKKESPPAAVKPAGPPARAAASGTASAETPPGFEKHVTPKGTVFWVEREGAQYPPEFDLLDPEAQEAWRKARYKIPLTTDFIKAFPRKVRAAWIKRWSDGPALEAQGSAGEAYAKRRKAEDRSELVRPAPAGFKPERGRKAKLTLIPKSRMIRSGESFWYRLELQNAGSEPIELNERPSFWKVGNALQLKYEFFVTPPDGKEEELVLHDDRNLHGIPRDYRFPKHLRTLEEKQRFLDELNEKRRWEVSRWNHLMADLQPGETLVTRPWEYGNPDERRELLMYGDIPDKPVAGGFRELALRNFKFDKPGTYRIRAVYDDAPPPLDGAWEEYVKQMMEEGYSRDDAMKDYRKRVSESWGVVESNTVFLEVHP